jgi:NAD(P)-dependent dehydrogenase (short-subunit alcohol dehydrogenase family)
MKDLQINKIFSIKDKKILVTGAAGGLGKSVTIFLLKNKAKVIATDISKINLNHPNLIKFEKIDLSDKNDFSILKNYINKIKKISGLINFCGVAHNNNFREVVNINYIASYDLMELFTSYIIKNKIKKSSLINLTSLNSEMAFSNNPGYVSTKGALKMLSKSFAIDYAKYGIRFNNIGPGYFLTDMTKKFFKNKKKREERLKRIPLGRYGNPKEICGIVAYLLSDASSYVTGQDFYVDGGFLSKGV